MSLSEAEFDKVADQKLHALEEALEAFDPDEVDVELSQGVLTLTFADDQKCVVNSHRAAGQIWMAAFRTAWHFSPHQEAGAIVWRTEKDELHKALSGVLSRQLGRAVVI